ncbi:hypothetical protein HanRHA438_Chr16g0760461 [Helianthus annuus]|nr:hypothetical protein HanHA300_Chr16g0610651 [Helianthus annuus]KAJ0442816.1 hypothetical protein HanIR_Chr16g0813681 [Helianthus annuus]KAJ0460475.1 hypothetical protein HanHA89_Chr16g0661251 [Helianthus annuus]KAJ0640913.1 hypothetical protein HanLR1_Chr16g0621121 [Helianthus annuus]KAJ0835884.1 hypothetical protein HanRHA438_Chr16g0760461 [Helianthus annuus]
MQKWRDQRSSSPSHAVCTSPVAVGTINVVLKVQDMIPKADDGPSVFIYLSLLSESLSSESIEGSVEG